MKVQVPVHDTCILRANNQMVGASVRAIPHMLTPEEYNSVQTRIHEI